MLIDRQMPSPRKEVILLRKPFLHDLQISRQVIFIGYMYYCRYIGNLLPRFYICYDAS